MLVLGRSSRCRTAWLTAVGLAALCLAVFAPVRHHDFLAFDDADYVVQHPVVQRGLTLDGLRGVFTTAYAGNWHPLTWMSYMVDVEVHGGQPGWLALTNVAWHALAAMALFSAFRTATGRWGPSAFTAALFAVHPLHVESVAWIAQRKDVLAGAWWMLTLAAHVRYVAEPSRRRRALVLLCGTAALLSKPTAVTLPITLLLVDEWPLRRTASWHARLREKLPLVVMSAAVAAATLASQAASGAIQSSESVPWALRLANVPVAYVTYLWQTIWPAGLAALYPYPDRIPAWQAVPAALSLGAATVIIWRARVTAPYLAVGWLWFLLTLVPTIGLIQVGAQPHADRYMYIPSVGLFVAAAWGLAGLAARWPTARLALAAAGAIAVGLLAVAARAQAGTWRNDEALWRHAVAVTRDNYRARTFLGHALAQTGRLEEARLAYLDALALNPQFADARNYLGQLYLQIGNVDGAIAEFERAIAAAPPLVEAHNSLGLALVASGRLDEAARAFSEAVRLQPGFHPARVNLGLALSTLGRHDEALAELKTVVEAQPEAGDVRLNLAMALTSAGRPAEALEHYAEAARLGADTVRVHTGWATALNDLGRPGEAIEQVAVALGDAPASVAAAFEFGRALAGLGRTREAIEALEVVLRLDPAHADARRLLERLRR